MSNSISQYPQWVKIYLWITVAITVGASAAGYLKPDALFGTWEALGEAGALSFAGPVGLFLARNVGTAALGLYSLIRGHSQLLTAYLILRAVTDGMDCLHNLVAGNMPVAGMAGVMCVIEIFAVTRLNHE